MLSSTPDIRGEIRAAALREGFDTVRFAKAEASQRVAADLQQFLSEGRHGTMDWMARHANCRADPNALWPEARSVIVLGLNYGPKSDPRERLKQFNHAAISCYAQNDDYHKVMKAKLKRLARLITEQHNVKVKTFVDTAPVMEKPLAQSAGIGWQGKHTNLVSRLHGSWLFLGSIFTALEITPDEPETDRCGACARCLDVCPTNAFSAPYRIDARRCISYLTIEHKGHIAREFREKIGNRIYGCDDCLAVCPWNKFAGLAREARFHARAELAQPRLADLAQLADGDFRALFGGSPIKRIGRDRFIRNVLIAIGNSGDPSLARQAERLLDDSSSLVRAMAVWALVKLDARRAQQLTCEHLSAETDAQVREEWREATFLSALAAQ